MNKRVSAVVSILRKRYGGCDFRRERPYRALISTIISQRTKDETTDIASRRLFSLADTPEKMASLSLNKIESAIRLSNYHRTKARNIKKASTILIKDYSSRVPLSREELMKLPGVGGKTADIVMLVTRDEPVIPVDTHVAVVSKRLGWTGEDEPEKIRADLHRLFAEKERPDINFLLVSLGKEVCTKRFPKCGSCPLKRLCPYANQK